MNRYLFLFVNTLAIFAGMLSAEERTGPHWNYNYKAARREAEKADKPLFFLLYTELNVWSDYFLEKTISNPSITSTINDHFVAVMVNESKDAKLAERLRVKCYPTVLLASPDGRILDRIEGFRDVQALQDRLQKVLTAIRNDKNAD